MNIETIGQRIRQRRKELGLTQKDVSNAIKGVSNVAISQWESDTTKPNAENLVDLATALECDLLWLLRGENAEKTNIIPASIGANRVPLISYVQAGNWNECGDWKIDGDFDWVLTNQDVSDKAFALQIQGDSMEDEFKEGDIVIIDPNIKPHAGEFVVAVNEDYEATFKKYRPLGEMDEYGREHFELIALNQDYAPKSTKREQIQIIGTMIEHRIYRRKR